MSIRVRQFSIITHAYFYGLNWHVLCLWFMNFTAITWFWKVTIVCSFDILIVCELKSLMEKFDIKAAKHVTRASLFDQLFYSLCSTGKSHFIRRYELNLWASSTWCMHSIYNSVLLGNPFNIFLFPILANSVKKCTDWPWSTFNVLTDSGMTCSEAAAKYPAVCASTIWGGKWNHCCKSCENVDREYIPTIYWV